MSRGDKSVGLLTLSEITKVPRSSWSSTTVAQAMIPSEKLISTPANVEVSTAIDNMGQNGINQMPVVEQGRIIGVFSREESRSLFWHLATSGDYVVDPVPTSSDEGENNAEQAIGHFVEVLRSGAAGGVR